MSDQSQDKNSSISDDEIDLRELFVMLWRGKFFLIFCIVAAVIFAAIYLRSAERKYTVTYIFAPVASDDLGRNLGNLGGLASLAGVSLPSSSSGDFLTFKYLLKSEEVASVILENAELVREIFSQEWDIEQNKFKKPPDGKFTIYRNTLKHFLTGQPPREYIVPNAARLSDWMKTAFTATEDRETGFLTLSAETPKPEMLINLMALVTNQTDKLLKDRYIESAEKTMAFYQRQLAKARAREEKRAAPRPPRS